jgi:hypothetical protein
MRKYFFILMLICFGSNAWAQSISFFDLTNLSNLSNGEAHTYLVLGKVFKQQYLQEIRGKKIERFRSIVPNVKEQTVTIGDNIPLSDGKFLRRVSYTTQDPQHIVNLIAQAKRSRMVMKFQGTDASNNIYVFDNDFYHITMLISTTERKGSVEIKQKEFTGF